MSEYIIKLDEGFRLKINLIWSPQEVQLRFKIQRYDRESRKWIRLPWTGGIEPFCGTSEEIRKLTKHEPEEQL